MGKEWELEVEQESVRVLVQERVSERELEQAPVLELVRELELAREPERVREPELAREQAMDLVLKSPTISPESRIENFRNKQQVTNSKK